MSAIKKLPAEVIAVIAAGEVVERPAVVIKELIENALDAGATTIDITLENAGLDVIQVTDNGQGIPAVELEIAIQRHTTSKVFSLSDLSQIQSFGFRGEALASMASVSELTIETRTATESVGTRLHSVPNQSPTLQPLGRSIGTTVTVEQLFVSVPARLKFIQNSKAELRHCLAVVVNAALSHPSVRFTLTHHQKELLTLPAHFDVTTRLATVLKQPPSQLQPFYFEHTLATVSGSLGLPQIARKTKQDQYLFINGRPVSHPAINRIVKTAYGTLLAPRQEPTFLLNLELPPTEVDVNVHPRKEQVGLLHEADLLALIHQVIQERLAGTDTTYVWPPSTPLLLRDRGADAQTGSALKALTEPWRVGSDQPLTDIVQLELTYLIAPTPQGLIMVDQHAAHERILYEQFKAVWEGIQASPSSQGLVTLEPPQILEYSVLDSELLNDNLEVFTKIGFELEPFGLHSFKLSQVPALVSQRNYHHLIQEVLDDLHHHTGTLHVDTVTDRTLAFLACRSAIKAGDFLTLDQRRSLLAKLATTPNHATCPHGRPTLITITLAEFETLFKRR